MPRKTRAANTVEEIKRDRKAIKAISKNATGPNERRDTKRLTYQQCAFVDAYVADPSRNGTKAAAAAGYTCPEQASTALLKLPKVKSQIERATRRASLSAAETLGIIAELASSDMSDFTTVNTKTGKVKYDIRKAQETGKTRCIKSMKLDHEGNIIALELWDKSPYVQMMAKNLGLLIERIALDVTVDRSEARNQLAAKLASMMPVLESVQRGEQVTENGNVTGLPVIDVTDQSTQPLDGKEDASK